MISRGIIARIETIVRQWVNAQNQRILPFSHNEFNSLFKMLPIFRMWHIFPSDVFKQKAIKYNIWYTTHWNYCQILSDALWRQTVWIPFRLHCLRPIVNLPTLPLVEINLQGLLTNKSLTHDVALTHKTLCCSLLYISTMNSQMIQI